MPRCLRREHRSDQAPRRLDHDRLGGRPAGSGATDEGDGSSEIELEIETDDLDVLGTPAADHLVVGRASHVCTDIGSFHWSAVNLNAKETVPDADVFDCANMFNQTSFSSLVGRGGNDVLALVGEGLSDFELGGCMTCWAGPATTP